MAHVEPLREDDPTAVGVYRLLGRLGAGGQGTVYLGQAPDGRSVAVKVLRGSAGFDDRFVKEIEAARRVEPFCIAQVLDASLGRQPYIVTEYVDGPSLQQAGRHTGADLQRLAVAMATALAAIHQAGVVHRDFKPANVLLGPGGPRVIDFGIARAADAAATVTSGIVGTPAYMAPEQLAGQAVGPAADVFAWASVVVYAATGTPPFGQDTLPAIINRILHNEPQLGDVAPPLRSIVYDCLAKDPQARPAMKDVLLRLLGGPVRGPVPGRVAGPPGATPPPGPSSPGPSSPGLLRSPGAMPLPGAMPGPGAGPGPMPVPGAGPMPMAGPGRWPEAMPERGPAAMPGPGGMPGQVGMPGSGGIPGGMPGPGGMPAPGGMPGVAGSGRGRAGVPVAVGVSGVLVAALVGGIVWLAPWSSGWAGQAQPAIASPSPSPSTQPTRNPATTPPPRRSTPKPTRKPTEKATPKTTSSRPSSPTPGRTTARPTPSPTRTTKKPVTSARLSILALQVSGGPGQSGADGCYMPPVHFQTDVESSRQGIWVSGQWEVDGRVIARDRSWVPEDAYTAFMTSDMYMLKAGSHRVTLRVTSPTTVSKSISIDVCAVESY
jgi:predicted Ser/Thr protein kinase